MEWEWKKPLEVELFTELSRRKPRTGLRLVALALVAGVMGLGFSAMPWGTWARQLLYHHDPAPSAVAVVLNGSSRDLPGRIAAAGRLYQRGLVAGVVVNGGRHSPVMAWVQGRLAERDLPAPCPWYAEHLAILRAYDVPLEDVTAVTVANAYDTISESDGVAAALAALGIDSAVITTSGYHTRRAHHIWSSRHGDRLTLSIAADDEVLVDDANINLPGPTAREGALEGLAWLLWGWRRLSAGLGLERHPREVTFELETETVKTVGE